MNSWLDVVAGVVLGLLVNEGTEISPWLAHKVLRWAGAIQQPGRAAEFAEERSATINSRPGKTFKLCTALGFLLAAMVHRAVDPGTTARSRRLAVLRLRVLAAIAASGLYAATWGLISLFLGKPSLSPMVSMGLALFVVAMVVFHLPLQTPKAALYYGTLPAILMSLLWIGADFTAPLVIATLLAPVYGTAQAVRMLLRDSRLLARIASVVAIGTVITATAVVQLETMPPHAVFPFSLGMTGLGLVGGLCVEIGLLLIEHVENEWHDMGVTPPAAIRTHGRD
ncbi:hypothetical protein ACIBCH_13400 [Amycolatopsis thailandensis]|uniref:hypothetical protein n=1 Tax=Amycolatopsis thailandensis TaxID=589330 RepID=UPI003791107F